MKKFRGIISFVLLLSSTLACNLVSKALNPSTQPGDALATQVTGALATEMSSAIATVETTTGDMATAEPQQPPAGADIKSEFPLPSDVSNYTAIGDNMINFQTGMGLNDALAFYRDNFAKMGYTERAENTVISDNQTFSIVFDGHPSGKAIIVQGVDIGDTVNISIRLEDI